MERRKIHVVVILGLILLTVACSNKKTISGRVARGPNTRSNSASNGIVTNVGNGFQPAGDVSAFFSNFQNQDGTSYVLPCPVTQISVPVAQVTSPADPNTGTVYSSVSSTGAHLSMDFLLSCTANDNNNQPYNNIQVDIGDGYPGFVGASGEVDGSYATISFQDNLGTITLSGILSNGQFSGMISYSNNFYYDQSGSEVGPGASGNLAQFTLPACNVFQCTTAAPNYASGYGYL